MDTWLRHILLKSSFSKGLAIPDSSPKKFARPLTIRLVSILLDMSEGLVPAVLILMEQDLRDMKYESDSIKLIGRTVLPRTMPELKEPIVTLEQVKIHAIHFSSLDLEVKIKVQNSNPVSATLRELPFTIYFRDGERERRSPRGTQPGLRSPQTVAPILSSR